MYDEIKGASVKVKIKIPIVMLIPILIVLVLLCTRCAKKEENEIVQNNDEKLVTISRGEWEAKQYNNEFFDIKFNLPESWNKYSEEEIAQLMNIELNELEKIKENAENIHDLAEKQEVYAMAVNNPSTGAKIIIMFRKVSTDMTEEIYLNNLKKQLEKDRTMEYEIGRIYTEKISGEEYSSLKSKIINFGVEQMYYVRKQENYIISIIVTTMQDSEQRQILKYFE